MGALESLRSLRMAGFWMQQVSRVWLISVLLCTPSDYSQVCQTSLVQLLHTKKHQQIATLPKIPEICIFSFLNQNKATDPPLDSSRRTLSEKLDRVSSRRVWSQEIAPKINHAGAPEPPETSPTVLAVILLLSPDVSANNLKTLSVKGWPGT